MKSNDVWVVEPRKPMTQEAIAKMLADNGLSMPEPTKPAGRKSIGLGGQSDSASRLKGWD